MPDLPKPGNRQPIWWAIKPAEGNWTPGSIPSSLEYDLILPQFGVCFPGLLWSQLTGPAHQGILISNSSWAFAA